MNPSRRAVLSTLLAGGLLTACSAGPAPSPGSGPSTSAPVPAPSPSSSAPPLVRIAPLSDPNLLTLSQQRGAVQGALVAVGARGEGAPPSAGPAEAAAALAAGRADITSGTVTSLLTALVADPELRAFAVEAVAGESQALVATPQSGVVDVAALVGRSVAVDAGGSGEHLLLRALQAAGVPVDQVQRIYLAPADAEAAFTAGQVDAWATRDLSLARALSAGAVRLTDAAELDAPDPVVHLTTRTFAAERPEALRAVLGAVVAQGLRLQAEPGQLAQAHLDAGASEEAVAVVEGWPTPTAAPAGPDLELRVALTAAFLRQQGVLPQGVDVRDAVLDLTVG